MEPVMNNKNLLASFFSLFVLILFLSVTGCKSEEPKETAKQETAKPLVTTPANATAKTIAEYTFENGIDKWAPRGNDKIELSSEKKHGGNSSLKISGASASPYWNYAASPMSELEPNKSYRLSGWMLVESIGDPKFAPHFKCGLTNSQNKDTKYYNLEKMNEWQELSVDFPVGANPVKAEVAVEKGTDKKVDAIIYIDDIKIDELK
jgi:hypothetical protein